MCSWPSPQPSRTSIKAPPHPGRPDAQTPPPPPTPTPKTATQATHPPTTRQPLNYLPNRETTQPPNQPPFYPFAGDEVVNKPWLRKAITPPVAAQDPPLTPTRLRPYVYVYDVPPDYSSDILQYRIERSHCTYR